MIAGQATFLPHSRCDARSAPCAQGFELRPHDRGRDPFAPRKGAEAAIGRRDDALAVADRRDRLLDAAARPLPGARRNCWSNSITPGIRIMSFGNGCCLERRVFVLVARIGELDRERAGVGLVEHRQHLRERDVVDVRAFPVAPADMQPPAVARNALAGLVDRREMHLGDLDEALVGLVLEHHHAFHREIGRIDLQDQPGLVDRAVFLARSPSRARSRRPRASRSARSSAWSRRCRATARS